MTACLLAGAMAVALGPGGGFSLEWTHSIEKTGWREDWRVLPDGMHLIRAAVRGSGAGMEPGPDGRLIDGWWVWAPQLPPIPELVLAASGATGGGWRLCAADCVTLAETPAEPLILRPCP